MQECWLKGVLKTSKLYVPMLLLKMRVHLFLPIMENYSHGHFMPDTVLNGQAKAHSINTQLKGVSSQFSVWWID